jgi:hypothetical protein
MMMFETILVCEQYSFFGLDHLDRGEPLPVALGEWFIVGDKDVLIR